MKTSEGPNPVTCSWFLESWTGYFLKLKFPPFLTIGSWPLAKQPVCSGVFSVYSDVFVGLKCLYCWRGFCRAVQAAPVSSVWAVCHEAEATPLVHIWVLAAPAAPLSSLPELLHPWSESTHLQLQPWLFLVRSLQFANWQTFCTKLHFISLMLYWIFHIFPWEQWFIFLVKII